MDKLTARAVLPAVSHRDVRRVTGTRRPKIPAPATTQPGRWVGLKGWVGMFFMRRRPVEDRTNYEGRQMKKYRVTLNEEERQILEELLEVVDAPGAGGGPAYALDGQIGRASCRERG